MAQVVFDAQSLQVQGDLVTVTALVDGRPITVTCWLSYLNTLSTKAARQAYLAGLLKATAYPPIATGPDLSGTVTV